MISILFIGNSYTYYNDLPSIFADIAKAESMDVNTTAITKGGWTLEKYCDANDEFGAKVALELDYENKGKFDYVVIQEQSLRPITEPELFFAAVRDLALRAKAIGAKPLLYSTWGRKTGSPQLLDLNLTNAQMTQKLAESYGKIGAELDIPVAYVGRAFFEVYSNNPEIELYDPDLTHPSENGSTLAALTLFGKIFGVEPTTLKFPASDILKKAAQNTL